MINPNDQPIHYYRPINQTHNKLPYDEMHFSIWWDLTTDSDADLEDNRLTFGVLCAPEWLHNEFPGGPDCVM